MFLAYNNGIVATVDDLEIVNDRAGRPSIKSLKGLQIVNGGQTTASLHRARRKDGLNLGSVAVPIKIIKVGGADLSEMVYVNGWDRHFSLGRTDADSGPFAKRIMLKAKYQC